MSSDLIARLTEIVGEENVITPSDARYWAYTFGDATMYRSKPQAVVYPGSTDEVSQIIRLAKELGTFIVPAGGLTGLSGGANAQGGVLMNTLRMNQIKSIDPLTRTVVAGPGISCLQLNDELAPYGFVVPVAPASQAISTLGANVAEAAGGTWGMSKGTFKNYLMTLEIVDGQGRVFNTAKPFPKQSTGPDLTALFLGSEGTMGVITEVTLRCDKTPEDTWTIRARFEDESVLQAIHEAVAEQRIDLYSFEYMDSAVMQAMGKEPTMLLLLQTAGHPAQAKADAEKVVAILDSLNPLELKHTNDKAEADELYAERRSALGALAKADPDKPVIVQFDPVLPVARFAEGVQKMRELADEAGLTLIIYGHAGDGNLHPSFVIPDDTEQKKKAREVIRKFDDWIEENGGVFSGEHGVGFFLGRDMESIRGTGDYLRSIKKAFDPDKVLNPGKVVDIVEPGLAPEGGVQDEYADIAHIVSMCAKCHLCKNDSPLYKTDPAEHNTIRGRISMIDAATRGWVQEMNCPTFIKEHMNELIDKAIEQAQGAPA
jgi:glycolate oxidase